MAVRLTISVSDVNTVMATFNVIQIRRSITTVDGDYELITALTPVAVTLLAPTAGNYSVVGKTLQLKIDSGSQVDVVFTGTNPLTAAQVASQIDAAVGSAVATDEAGTLRLTSTTTGTSSAVEIVGGGAAADFGWVAEDRDIGEDAHVALITDQSLYNYTDEDGIGDYFYTVQYLNTATSLRSTESDPFQGEPGTLVSATKLSTGKIDLVDASGIAVPDQDISFYSIHEPLQVEGFEVALIRGPKTITTNNAGHAEVILVRGLKLKVVFEGTNFIREITVPDQDEFDLLTLMTTAPDPYSVAAHTFPSAIRRTI